MQLVSGKLGTKQDKSYLGAVTVLLSLILSPLPHGIGSTWANYALLAERHTLADLRELIPDDASLSVQNNLGAHLSQWRDVASFPRRVQTARYVLLHLRYVGGPDSGLFVRTSPEVMFQMPVPRLRRLVEFLVLLPEWGLVAWKDGFYLFERGAPSVVAEEEALQWVSMDFLLLEESLHDARRHRLPLSRYLVGRYGWGHVMADTEEDVEPPSGPE